MSIPGLDYLGAGQSRKFQRAILKAHPKGYAAGFMAKPFKSPIKFIRELCRKRGKDIPAIRLQGLFKYDHKFPRSDWPYMAKLGGELNKIALQFPKILFFYSPACEHNLDRAEATALMIQCQKFLTAPNIQLVNTIWKGATLVGVIDEVHGRFPDKPDNEFYIVSEDGVGGDGKGDSPDMDHPERQKKYADAVIDFKWGSRFNGKFKPDQKVDISRRTWWPSEDYIKQHAAFCEPPAGNYKLPSSVLGKPMADDHGEGGKDNKLLFIAPERADQAEVLDCNGKVINKMRRVTPDHQGDPKGARYYSDLYAYQLKAKAQKSGCGLVRIRIGKKTYPAFDPVFRTSRWRNKP